MRDGRLTAAGVRAALASRAAAAHGHDAADLTGGTVALARLPVAADGVSSATDVVRADDGRLSDARAPTGHGHAIADVSGLQSALDDRTVATAFVEPSSGGTVDLDLGADVYLVSAYGGATTARLPAAASHAGRVVTIKRTNTNGNAVSVSVVNNGYIDEVTYAIPLNSVGGFLTLVSNGAQWWIISRYGV